MTTTFFLIRHATHDRVASMLCGRIAGVNLSAEGRAQAQRLADCLAGRGITAVQTSPLERARETAEPIAERLRVPAEPCEAITEIDFGEWSGRALAALHGETRWSAWNAARSVTRPPGGETMLEVQARMVRHLERMRAERSGSAIALVSHGDVIKAGLLYYLGLPVDAHQRIEISPASVSTVAVGDWGAQIIGLNEVVAS